uniref:Uncharacterized protein n=1 Tax=Rhizophagus irregularis (strain DAOM 181602 / DAOM 197198 / MUCL 43194) TaxID=747089 RepID=U9U3Q2_RHIID
MLSEAIESSTSTKNDFGKSMLVNTHRPIFIGPGTEIFTLGADNFNLIKNQGPTEYSSDTLIQPKVRKKIGALASGGDSNFTRSRCLLIFEGHECKQRSDECGDMTKKFGWVD